MATPDLAPLLPLLDNERWALRCTSAEQRDELLAYAAKVGAPLVAGYDINAPGDLVLAYCIDGVLAYAGHDPGSITPAMFKRLCRAYVARHS